MSRSKSMPALTRKKITDDSVIVAQVAGEFINALERIGVLTLDRQFQGNPERIGTALAPSIAGMMVLLWESENKSN